MDVREQFKEAIAIMIGGLSGLPDTHQDVVEAAQRCFDHVLIETYTIKEVERQRKARERFRDAPRIPTEG